MDSHGKWTRHLENEDGETKMVCLEDKKNSKDTILRYHVAS